METHNNATFSSSLTQAMKNKGYTQETLAKQLAISASAVSRWLSGSLPRPARLKLLADVLGVTVRYLEFGLDPQAEKTLKKAADKKREELAVEDALTEQTIEASEKRRKDIEALVHEHLKELCDAEYPTTGLLIAECTDALTGFRKWVQAYREKMLAKSDPSARNEG